MQIAPSTRAGHAEPMRPNDRFVALLNAYRGSGGMVRGGEVLALFGRRGACDLAQLARRMLERQVIAFEWQSQTWLPWFQFNALDLGTHAALAPMLVELNAIYSPWELASWFVQRNDLLDMRTPVEVFSCDPDAVQHAACTQRWAVSALPPAREDRALRV